MNETKRRGWIKNVIIIFLVIMLVLTLFSNTIMNRSLPEVSVSNSESGQITSQIKLSGSVSANQVKQITLDAVRTIDTVLVRRGDTVARGDVLATLIAGESSEIYDLEIELQRLEIEYKEMLKSEGDSLVTHRRTIEDSRKALTELQVYIDGYPALEAAVRGYEDQITVLENDIKSLEAEIDGFEQSKEELQETMDTLDESIADLQKQQKDYPEYTGLTQRSFEKEIEQMEDAIEELEDQIALAKSERSAALADRNAAQAALEAFDLSADIEDLKDRISDKEDERDDRRDERNALAASATPEDPKTEALAALDAQIDALTEEINALLEELEALEDALAESDGYDATQTRAELEAALQAAKSAYSAKNSAYNDLRDEEAEAEVELDEYSDGGFAYLLLQSRIEEYEDEKEPLEKEYAAQDKEIAKVEKRIKDIEELLAEAEELLAEAEAEIEKTPEDCEDEKLELTRAIEDAENAIALAEANGAIEDETAALNLKIKRSEIDRKKKEIADLKAETTETEITAPVGGTVASVGITAGDEIEADTVAFEITMTDMGYTMECSVTNSQAARLRVGQEAEVQYYYWGAKPSVRITQIVSDPNSGGKNKLITFTVEGDVSEGTSLSLVIGSQGSSYDTVVPNSAIREDANGQFILKVVSKSSPLGNRYYAERLDVEVLASDATKSAIDASLSWGDYVITGASVPISEGMQVRMAEK